MLSYQPCFIRMGVATTTGTAVWASAWLAELWHTPPVAGSSKLVPCIATAQVPLPLEKTLRCHATDFAMEKGGRIRVYSSASRLLRSILRRAHSIEVSVFDFEHTLYVRVSTPVYVSRASIRRLGHAVAAMALPQFDWHSVLAPARL